MSKITNYNNCNSLKINRHDHVTIQNRTFKCQYSHILKCSDTVIDMLKYAHYNQKSHVPDFNLNKIYVITTEILMINQPKSLKKTVLEILSLIKENYQFLRFLNNILFELFTF